MVLNGKRLAQNILAVLKNSIADIEADLHLGVLVFQKSTVTEQFTRMKKEAGEAAGITVDIIECGSQMTTEKAIQAVHDHAQTYDGIIVQLPLPDRVDTEAVLAVIPAVKDVDGIGGQQEVGTVVPPVVAAIREILNQYCVKPAGKNVVVVGKGRLVGAPAAKWFTHEGAQVRIATSSTKNLSELTRSADIIVLGTGVPGLLTEEMVQEGVVVLDAGSGEIGGRIAGDADASIVTKASLFTPTPGGIGPVAVAMIFANLLTLCREDQKTPLSESS